MRLPNPCITTSSCNIKTLHTKPSETVLNTTNSEVCATLGNENNSVLLKDKHFVVKSIHHIPASHAEPQNLNDTIQKKTNKINVQQNLLLTEPMANTEMKIIKHNVLKEPEKYWSLPSVQTYQDRKSVV